MDAGYTTMPGFIAPYRGVRYHQSQTRGRTPRNEKELFNQRHSKLRSKIECAFGTLKNRFCILGEKKFHSFSKQVDIVLACCILHNFILGVDPHDGFVLDEVNEGPATDIEDDIMYPYDQFTETASQSRQRTMKHAWEEYRDNIAAQMWHDYCSGIGS